MLLVCRSHWDATQVEVQAEVDGWLHCANQYGVRGLVPATYIRILSSDEGPGDALSQLFGGYSQPVRHPSLPQRLLAVSCKGVAKLFDTTIQADQAAILIDPSCCRIDLSPLGSSHLPGVKTSTKVEGR